MMPMKSVPVSVTLCPATPLPGATPVMVGVTSTVKVGLFPVPALFVTAMVPVAAPTGTVASIWVSETRVKLAPGALGKSTAVMPTKSVPVSVTLLAGHSAGGRDTRDGRSGLDGEGRTESGPCAVRDGNRTRGGADRHGDVDLGVGDEREARTGRTGEVDVGRADEAGAGERHALPRRRRCRVRRR